MARRLTLPLAAAFVAAMVLAACGGASGTAPSDARLAAKKVTIGGLEVTITPTRLDSTAAEFKVVFDTHTGAPEIDVAGRSALVVDGTPWADPAWSGDGPGGHHRSGTLRFIAAGPARGDARLTMSGLDQPLEVGWQLL